MLGHDYTRRHNEVVKCKHLTLCKKFGIRRSNKLRSHSVTEVVANENAEIRVDTRVKTDIIIKHNRPDIVVHDKKRKEITLIEIEIGITNLDLLTQVENEKTRKYDVNANEMSMMYKCKVNVIRYAMTWDSYEFS